MKRTKDEVQAEAIREFLMNDGSGIIAMATGTGKSKIAITLATEQWKRNPDCQILLVVPTQKLRDNNWKDEFDKWNAHHIWAGNVTRICYASLYKVTGYYDFVILDEVHNITENNSVFFENTMFNQIIGLTATMPNKIVKLDILKKYGLNVVYTVTTDEAVEWGLISPYKITIVYSSLDRINKNVVSGRKESPFFQTEVQAYEYITKTIKSLQYEEVKDLFTGQVTLERRVLSANESARLQMLILKRMHLIYNLTSKFSVALYIRDHMISNEDRTLIFAGSIKQAEAICKNSYHSKSKKTDYSFDEFCEKKINMLSCVDSLNEGHNIPDVDNALILQLNSSKLDMVQRIGRIVRYRDGHIANIFIVVAKDTVDEDWVGKALQDFDDDNITKILFNDLKLQRINEAKSRTEEYFY